VVGTCRFEDILIDALVAERLKVVPVIGALPCARGSDEEDKVQGVGLCEEDRALVCASVCGLYFVTSLLPEIRRTGSGGRQKSHV